MVDFSIDRIATRAPRAARAALLAALLPGAPAIAPALDDPGARVLGDGVALHCRQPTKLALECEYRLVEPARVVEVSATLSGFELPPPQREPMPADATTAVLFLVDTSDPARAQTVARNAAHVRALLDAAGPGHVFGLATFDTDLRMEAPIGSEREAVAAAAERMRAVGRTTELYRNALEAVRRLASFPAERRALLLFSDGLAEDRAYFHQDVIEEARRTGVVVYGIGYARSVALSVALQTLRRLAEETGGVFVAADTASALPEEFLEGPFRVVDNGGRLRLDLSSAEEHELSGSGDVRLVWITERGAAAARVPVSLPAPPPPAVPAPIIVQAPPPAPAATAAAPAPGTRADAEPAAPETAPAPEPAPAVERSAPAAPEPAARPRPARIEAWASSEWIRYAGAAAVVLALLLLVAGMALGRRRRTAGAGTAAAPAPGSSAADGALPMAFLELQGSGGRRQPIRSAAFRLGRHSDNDLTLNDPSISRHHAEIHRRRDGSFTITDLDSMNGVYVNGDQVKKATLRDGDSVELGDVGMRFHVYANEAPAGEETVMLKTAAPSGTFGRP